MPRKENIPQLDKEFATAADDFFNGTLERTDREDVELSALLDTLQRVEIAFSDSADSGARERIRREVRKAWFSEQDRRAAKNVGIFSQLMIFFQQNRRQTRLAVSFAMILLVALVMPLFLQDDPALAATAGEFGSSKFPLLILLFAVFASALILTIKQKK